MSAPIVDAGSDRAPLVRRVAREPLVHFLLLGALLFALATALRGRGGAPAGAIEVTASDVERLGEGFRERAGRAPTAAELAALVRGFVRDEALYREALALGLDRGDPVVRQRLVDKMAFVSRDLAPPPEPSEAELRAWLAAHAERFAEPTRVWFTQLFFDEPRRGPAGALAAANAALARLRGASAADAPPGVGDDFVLPSTFAGKTEAEIAHLFGAELAAAVIALEPGAWAGPVRSRFGLHVVRASRREPARAASFAEARERVRAAWLEERRPAGGHAEEERLIAKHPVKLAPEAARLLEGAR